MAHVEAQKSTPGCDKKYAGDLNKLAANDFNEAQGLESSKDSHKMVIRLDGLTLWKPHRTIEAATPIQLKNRWQRMKSQAKAVASIERTCQYTMSETGRETETTQREWCPNSMLFMHASLYEASWVTVSINFSLDHLGCWVPIPKG